jgi:hypothetical protein
MYRVFKCKKMVNREMERALVLGLSGQGVVPKIRYQDKRVRIEEYFVSRTLTIFEMRNPLFINKFAKLIAEFHCNK